ncbi:MAG: alkaline phosphatase family protein [Pseudomonadota bacterium]
MTKSSDKVIVILADGARYDQLATLIDNGQMPNARRLFREEGSLLKGSTVFPSTTGPAYLPFITGASPAACNVPGIRWFDKDFFRSGAFPTKQHRSYVGLESFLLGNDISESVKTIFELVDESYSIFNPVTRGAGKRNLTRYMRIWYWYYAHLTDHWASADRAALAKLLKAINRKKNWRYIFTVIPGIDECSHLTTPESPVTLERYAWLDEALGILSSHLKSIGLYDRTSIWLVSDHGLSSTHTHFCLNTFLEKRDISTFFYPLILNRKGKTAANMVSGNGMTHLYFKGESGWPGKLSKDELHKISPNLVDDLISEKAIDIVLSHLGDGWVEASSKSGTARMKSLGDALLYEVAGSDPFGYEKLPEKMSIEKALTATIDTDYPDGILQAAHLMSSKRAGDIVLSANPGYDLRLKYESPEHFSSHGSLHREHMLVPICCNRKFEAKIARTLDVFPTILNQIGTPIPEHVEGKTLI